MFKRHRMKEQAKKLLTLYKRKYLPDFERSDAVEKTRPAPRYI